EWPVGFEDRGGLRGVARELWGPGPAGSPHVSCPMSCPMSSRGPEGGPWVSSVAVSGFSALRTTITQRSNGRHGSASSAPGYQRQSHASGVPGYQRHGHASGVPGYWGFQDYQGLRGVG